jgi:heme-degrading monooxygenase HmoA
MYRFIWKIKLNDDIAEDEFIKHWHDSSAVLQEYPGAKGTLIHKARNEERTFFLVAQWESKAARDAMQAEIDAGKTERAKRWQAFAKSETFGEIQVVMAGEEIGAVLPEQTQS